MKLYSVGYKYILCNTIREIYLNIGYNKMYDIEDLLKYINEDKKDISKINIGYALEKMYNAFIYKRKIYFKKIDDCENACDWLDSLIIILKFKNN